MNGDVQPFEVLLVEEHHGEGDMCVGIDLYDGTRLREEHHVRTNHGLLQVTGDVETAFGTEQQGVAVESRGMLEEGFASFQFLLLGRYHNEALVFVEMAAAGVESPFAQQAKQRECEDVVFIAHDVFAFRTQM